jgi:replication-associated recombination protein RarA
MSTWEHKWAPRDYGGFAVPSRGQTAVRQARDRAARARESGYPLNLCLCGPSGCGKSTLARLLATIELGASDDGYSIMRVSSTRASAELADIDDQWAESTLFASGWRVLIVEEAHQLSPAAVTRLLTMAEAGIRKRAILLTTTDRPGELPGGSTGAFCSRFAPLCLSAEGMAESRGAAGAGAQRLRQIAQAEGVDGHDDGYYVAIMRAAKGNLRLAIQTLEDALCSA